MGAGLAPAVVALIGGAAGTVTWAVAIKTALINVGLGLIQSKLAKRSRSGGQNAAPTNVTVRTTVEHRRIILGERRAGGCTVFYNTSSSVAGSATGDLLWYVVVYAGHQVEAITHLFLDSEKIDQGTINAGGIVATGKFQNKVGIWKYLGTQAQTADAGLDAAFSQWTTAHRLRGCAYVVVRLTRDDTAFPGGAPQSITAIVRGAKCYDNRLDSTNGGSGTHRRTDPSTWTFTRNPAVLLRWYLTGGSVVNDQVTRLVRYGLRETDARIADAYTIAASNICDEQLTGANAPPGGADTRYRCDIEVTCAESRREIIEAILASMAGTLVNVHGQWRMYAGAYDIPTHSINEQELYDRFQVQDTVSHEQRYNAVCAVYIDAGLNWIEQTTIFRTDVSYETQDGGERINEEIQLRAVTSPYRAQRLAEIHLRKSRMMRSVTLVGALNLLRVALNETMLVSHKRMGWTSRVFRCVSRELRFNENAGQVTINATRDDAGVWTDLLTADYTTGRSATDTFVNDGPAAPTALLIQPLRDGINFAWQLPPSHFGGGLIAQLFEHSAPNPFSAASKVWEGRASSVFLDRLNRVTRYYWLRFAKSDTQVSGTFPAGDGSPAVTASLNQWVIRGNAMAHDNQAYPTGPTDSGAWSGLWGAHSVESFPVCHLRAKHSPGHAHTFLAITEDPIAATDYPSLKYAMHVHSPSNQNVNCFELGTNVGVLGTWNTTTELAITYDGTNVRYLINRAVVRTVSDPGRRWHGLVSFYRNDLGQSVNCLYFGPSTNLDYVDTSGMTPLAATDVLTTTAANVNILGSIGGPDQGVLVASLTMPAYPVATQHVVTAAGTVVMSAPSQVFSCLALIRDINNGTAIIGEANTIARNPSTALPDARASYIREVWYNVAANTAKSYYLFGLGGPPTQAGSSASLQNTTFKVEVIKR